MSYLVLVRHGLSEYNKQGLWTGWDDPALAEEGVEQAKQAAKRLEGMHFDLGYTSLLKRHYDTLTIILREIGQENLPVTRDKALNERNYGLFTRKNKWQVKKEVGEEEFQKIRRGWDYQIPEGESLKQVYDRVVPYFKATILPQLQQGKNVIISSSGNALRSLVKYLEQLSDQDIVHLEIGTGEVYVYRIDEQTGNILSKEIRNRNTTTV